MKRNPIMIALLVILALSLTACGPSEEEAAQMTQAAWTPTPPPTATPVPFDLSLSVTDAEGNPVAGASVQADGGSGTTDDSGSVSLADLPDDSAKITISAPGYFPAEMTEALQPGANQASASLELDPDGLLVKNACAPGEKLVYLEDFQDGQAQDWDAVENNLQGWSVEANPDNTDDMVIAAREGAPWAWLRGPEYAFDNAVWRFRFKYTGSANSQINFRHDEAAQQRYILFIGDEAYLARFDKGNHLDLGFAGRPQKDQWHLLEYSYYDGTVSVYIDGKQGATWTDNNPWSGGTLNLEPYGSSDSVYYYDDFSVCELSAPFQPIPRPETGYHLAVDVSDSEGNPLQYATVSVAEMSTLEEGTQVTGDQGSVSFRDLPGDSATVQVHAPGYFAVEETLTLEKAENQTSFTLERDAFGKLASELCRPEEEVLYLEDVQDGTMQGWNTLQSQIDLNVPGWSIIPEPEQEGNTVLEARGLGANTHSQPLGYENQSFGDSVIRFDARGFGDLHYILHWRRPQQGYAGYLGFIYADQGAGGRLEKIVDNNLVTVFNWSKYLTDSKWHTFEIATNQGEIQIWIDGRRMGMWTDPEPIAEGYFTLEHDFWKGDAYVYYDNFSVCGLSEPFQSIFAEE